MNKDEKDLKAKGKSTVKPTVKKPKTEVYILKDDVKIGGQWKKKGSKISLTKEGFRSFRNKKLV